MSITALAFIVIYGVGLFLTLRNPVYGVMTYIFEWHHHPPYHWWGDALPDLRWSYIIALVTLASWVLNRHKLEHLKNPDYKPVIWLVLMVINVFFVSKLSAVLPDESMRKTVEWFKILVNFVLMVQLIRTYKDYRMIIWVLILSTAHMGFVSFQEGSNRDLAVLAPNATEENALSSHIVAALPFFGVYFLTSKKWGKILTILGLPFCLNMLILANSRGSIVALGVISFVVLFLVKGKIRFAVLAGIVAGTFLFFNLTNQQFWERQSTTTQIEQESSAKSRIYIWTGAMKIFADHPFGVGGEGFSYLSMSYIPEIREPKSQHNTFIAILTDWGFLGLFFYLGFLVHIIVITFKIRNRSKINGEHSKYFLEATAIQLALLGLAVAGLSHSRQYAEMVYWLGAFAISLYNMQQNELESDSVPLELVDRQEPSLL